MPTPHERTAALALAAADDIAGLFAKLGTAAHPRGKILAAYRRARRALRDNLNRPFVVEETLTTLRREVSEALTEALRAAVGLGTTKAQREAAAYGLAEPLVNLATAEAEAVVLEALQQQLTAVRALSGTAGGPALVLGDGSRVGLLTPGPVTTEAAVWAARLLNGAYTIGIDQATRGTGGVWRRQAVAAIDNRTTDCCLRVHGQVVAIDQPFTLEGTPRFADELIDPPFHRWCRTAVALVHQDDVDDDLTDRLRSERRAALEEREAADDTAIS